MKTIIFYVAVMYGMCVAAVDADAAETLQASASKPNVVYIMADDLGWGDISIHGGSIPTPNIDRLFRQGVELRNFMGWQLCTPTRAMLLTGRHPFRVGTGPYVGGELASEETTIAEGFKANGYETGIFGKWHNGKNPDTPEFRRAFEEAYPGRQYEGGLSVNEHGFNETWIYHGGGGDYFTRRIGNGNGPVSWWHNREYRPQDEGYTEDLVTRRAIQFIRQNRDRPFFCYVPFHLVHNPMQVKRSDLRLVDPNVTNVKKRAYAAMVQALDRYVATILAELEDLDLRRNTIVVFTSDNGANMHGSNFPLRGGKGSIYEGGIRLPTVVSWPKGGLVSGTWDGLCGAMDMFPMLMAMANCEMPETQPLDGKNIWPALRRRGPSPVDSYYFVQPGMDAIRTARWKLIRYFDHFELYDIRQDEGESTNVADSRPFTVTLLTAMMDDWAESLSAALSHQPLPGYLDEGPAAEGDILEVTVTVTEMAGSDDRLVVPIALWSGWIEATDWVEFEIAVAPNSLRRGFFYSPVERIANPPAKVLFEMGDGIDQFGREQVFGPAIIGGPGVWEHRMIGLCSYAPGRLSQHALVFNGGRPGTYKVWLDNLRIRTPDGSSSSIWQGSGDTFSPIIEDSDLFKNVRVRTVPISRVNRSDD